MSTLEVLDAAWLAVRRNWLDLYACSAVGTAPLALATVAYFLWLGRLVQGTEASVFYQGTLVWAVIMAIGWALNGIARAAGTEVVLGDARAEPISLGAAWRRALRVGPSAAFVALFTLCATWLGGLAIVPGAGLACAWWVARPALVTERRPFLGSLRRGAKLTQGYRGKALALWFLLLLVWLFGFFNLHLVIRMLLGWVADLLGIDTTGLRPYLKLDNQAYTTFLLALVFVLLDPLKTAADALLYMDLRIRREGADLQERLRGLRAGAGLTALLLVPALASPARAVTVEEYRNRVRALREQISAAATPDSVPQADVRGVRDQLVQLPGGQKLTVGNDWLADGLREWKKPEDRQAVLSRLEALERSLGSGPAGTSAPAPAAGLDPKQGLKEILAEPEFQPLAERDELRELSKNLRLKNTKNWWQSFWDWLNKTLFKPARPQPPQVRIPDVKPPNVSVSARWMEALKWIAIGLGVVVLLVLLATLVRWFVERGPAGQAKATAAPKEAPPLEASATENALDHTVDEWELFARDWLGRGEIRQAVRALYLATLVHLHRERLIDYNRALTNWTYVRHFRGEPERKTVLQRLTQVFDDVWYGERPCEEPLYHSFEQGVRALGTPAPAAGPRHG